MTIHTHALFALRPDFAGAEWMFAQLAAEPSPLEAAIDRYRAHWRVTAWELGESFGRREIVGPGGFYLRFSRAVVEVGHLLPFFGWFARDDDHRAVLRDAFRTIAALVGSPRAIYIHELLPTGDDDDRDLDGIEAYLRANFGAPSPTFAALAKAQPYEPGCWYIDHFDLA